MCAINGSTKVDKELIAQMNAATKHRGPDGTGEWHGSVSFGHNRLAILDVHERSDQPMQSLDGRYVIVFNGEIYNYKDLRKELEGQYAFSTKSDTEVILAGYSVWGEKVFSRLRGMYSFGLFDTEKEELLLLRDPMGIKPLYLAKHQGEYVFSSELKGVLAAGVSTKLSHEAFSWYMRTLYVPAPLSIIKGVEKLVPGVLYRIRGGECQKREITYEPTRSYANLAAAVEDAIRAQFVSDKPVGMYLSGGIDSSVVLINALRAGMDCNTFSVGFSDIPEAEKFNADAVLAGRLAHDFGTTHHEYMIAPKDVPYLFVEAARGLDEPVGNATSVAQIALAEYARKHVSVVLTGDGGDEVFGGYERYRLSKLMDLYQKLPRTFRDVIPGDQFAKLNIEKLEDRFKLFHFQKDSALKGLLRTPLKDARISQGGSLMELDRRSWLVDEALHRSDRLTMAHGLEARAPLIDLELFAYVQTLPDAHVSPFGTKQMLKRAFKDALPEYILKQPKRGWFSPGAKWLRDPHMQELLGEVFSGTYAPNISPLFNWEEVQGMHERHKHGEYHATALISILVFVMWAKEYNIDI